MADFSNIDKDGDGEMDHFVVDIKNDIGTGSATIKELKIDGVPIPPEKVQLVIGNRPAKDFDPTSEIYSTYGDKISIHVEKEGGLEEGEHSLQVTAAIGWRTQAVSFKGEI